MILFVGLMTWLSYVYHKVNTLLKDFKWFFLLYEEYLLSISIILAAFNEAFTLHCHFISESTKVYVKEYFNSFKKSKFKTLWLAKQSRHLLFLHYSFHHFCFHTSTRSLYPSIHRHYRRCGSNAKVWKQNLLPHPPISLKYR